MKTISMKATGFAMCVAIPAVAAVAQEEDNPFTFNAEAGVRYDDNVTIDQSDNNSRRGDTSFLFKARLGADLYDKNKKNIRVRYSFSQSLYDDLGDFDLQIHGLTARAKTRIGKVNTAFDYRFNHITLGGQDFLQIHNFRPNIGWTVARKTYLTLAYEYRDLNFKDPLLQERDASRQSAAAKVYYLYKKGGNVTAGYKVSHHDATTEALSYWAHTADAGLKAPVRFGETEATFRLRYQYRQRDYSGVNATIGAERADRRHTLRTSLMVPFGEGFSAELEYKYVKSNSNQTTIDYSSNVVTFMLGYSF
jgi:hypothetical protein